MVAALESIIWLLVLKQFQCQRVGFCGSLKWPVRMKDRIYAGNDLHYVSASILNLESEVSVEKSFHNDRCDKGIRML